MKTAGIYIHIPFCKSKCNYCDYYSLEKREKDIPGFVEMLMREIEFTAKDHNKDWLFDTIYFGGGSPALLSSNDIQDILDKLYHHFNISKNIELTLEINPGETKKETLFSLKELGVNRLSIGFQSLDNRLLTTLSRTHRLDDCFMMYEDARVSGFDHINIDMMYNIPEQSLDRWVDDLKTLVKLDCDHIAIFPLTSEKGTPFYNQVNSGEVKLLGSHIEESMFTHCSQLLSKNGFIPYELAHFSKPGKECQHNQHYWNLEPYLAFGPSAHGYDGKKRWWNVSSLDDYMSKLSRNENPVAGFETLSYTDRFNEAVMYGLRTNKGISTEILQKFKSKVYLESNLNKWKSHLDVSKETIRIRPGHYHLVDEICTDMIAID